MYYNDLWNRSLTYVCIPMLQVLSAKTSLVGKGAEGGQFNINISCTNYFHGDVIMLEGLHQHLFHRIMHLTYLDCFIKLNDQVLTLLLTGNFGLATSCVMSSLTFRRKELSLRFKDPDNYADHLLPCSTDVWDYSEFYFLQCVIVTASLIPSVHNSDL
jgi:hypothetical protein